MHTHEFWASAVGRTRKGVSPRPLIQIWYCDSVVFYWALRQGKRCARSVSDFWCRTSKRQHFQSPWWQSTRARLVAIKSSLASARYPKRTRSRKCPCNFLSPRGIVLYRARRFSYRGSRRRRRRRIPRRRWRTRSRD